MKRILLTLFALGFIFSMNQAQAQTSERPINIGLTLGSLGYIGDLNDNSLSIFDPLNGQIGGNLGVYLSPSFDLGIQLTDGDWGASEDDGQMRSFDSNTFLGLGLLKYKLYNGKIMSEDAGFRPFIALGTGVAEHRGLQVNNGTDFVWSIAPGFNVPLNDKWGVTLQGLYNFHSEDNRDNVNSRDDSEDNSFMLALSLGYGISLGSDSDGDGVSDKNDACPNTPLNTPVDKSGCPFDKDGDGITDALDNCPEIAGVASASGCPDTDGDGIKDSDDKCPNVKGVSSLMGCPDSDGDGIMDSDDRCPNEAGTEAMSGCPDSDNDGVADAQDKCPNVKGSSAMMGCPDSDGDGVADGDDKCPNQPGIVANKGCPEVNEEVKQVFAQALTGIKFESGRDVIKTSSYGILNNVVKVMNDNPAYKVDINGHTDSQGDDAKNMDLSRRRAEAVKTYLMNKGIASNRMKTQGYGETRPIADNGTSAGRAQNRRVEFKVNF